MQALSGWGASDSEEDYHSQAPTAAAIVHSNFSQVSHETRVWRSRGGHFPARPKEPGASVRPREGAVPHVCLRTKHAPRLFWSPQTAGAQFVSTRPTAAHQETDTERVPEGVRRCPRLRPTAQEAVVTPPSPPPQEYPLATTHDVADLIAHPRVGPVQPFYPTACRAIPTTARQPPCYGFLYLALVSIRVAFTDNNAIIVFISLPVDSFQT